MAGTSVSQLVEDYLAAIVASPTVSSAPVLNRLRGSMRGVDVEDYRRHQVDTYA